MDHLTVMDKVYTLKEAADRLKMPPGSVRLGRGDARGLTPIQFADTPNAPIYYLVEEVHAVLRARLERIQAITNSRSRGTFHAQRQT